jgi:arginyl-tRNA synthetase
MNATPQAELTQRLRAALAACGLPCGRGEVVAAADTRFGDYQANAAMVLAKEAKANPRQLAAQIAERFEDGGICDRPEIAGPGFLNFRLRPDWTSQRLAALAGDARCGVPVDQSPQRIIIDFSSPNIAKPMHVGHIRSTILGDTLPALRGSSGTTSSPTTTSATGARSSARCFTDGSTCSTATRWTATRWPK